MELLTKLKLAMEEQNIPNEIVEKVLFQQATAIMIKTQLKNFDLMQENKEKNSSTKTSAITLTSIAMNIFLDRSIVEAQTKAYRFKENIVLIGENIMYLSHGKANNEIKKGIISCTAHVGIHPKSKTENQIYIRRVRDDDPVFNTFRSALIKGDSLAIIKLLNGQYCVMGFRQDQLKGLKKATYEIIGEVKNEENETIISEVNKTDYDEKEFLNSNYDDEVTDVNMQKIDLDAYENSNIMIDDSKECLRDLAESNQLREIRKGMHDRLVAYFGRLVVEKGHIPEKNKSIDLVFQKDDKTVVICEVKTLNGERDDLRRQALKAFSQLYYYKMFKLGKKYSTFENKEMAVIFDTKISDDFIDFFDVNEIGVFWREKDGFKSTDKAQKML